MFFKKDKSENEDLAKIAALLIHAAKIDENFTKKEEDIIKQALFKISGKNNDITKIIKKGKIIEENANQILDFTKEVKNMDEQNKIRIVEALWQIIYSNKEADTYETNLMRRLAGLLYIDDRIMGKIKQRVKKENS